MLQRLSARIGVSPPQISAEAYAALNRYAFPGNVRELENILERAIALSVSGLIDVHDLQLRAPSAASAADAAGSVVAAEAAATAEVDSSAALGAQLEHMEREAIIRALEQTRYNKTAAAKLLGMSFRALRYRVKKLGIE
jgi:two-component system response regulator PilR (NtrC family)